MARPQLNIGLNIQFQNEETAILDVLPQTSQVKKWNYKTWNYQQELSSTKTEREETPKETVSSGIQLLRRQVPGTDKMTRAKVLTAAVNYMIYLRDRILKLEENLLDCTEPITLI